MHIKSTRLGSEMGSLTSRCTGDVRCISLSQDSVVSEQCAVRASSQSQLSRLLGGRHRYLASGVCLLLAVQGYFPSHCGAELCAPTRTADKHRLPAFALRVEWGRGILWKGCDRDRWGAAKKHQPYTRRTPNIASAPSPSTDQYTITDQTRAANVKPGKATLPIQFGARFRKSRRQQAHTVTEEEMRSTPMACAMSRPRA